MNSNYRVVFLGGEQVPFPDTGELVWTWERDGDARSSLPEIGDPGLIRVECGRYSREYRATVQEHGRLRTQAGGNDRAVAWLVELLHQPPVADEGEGAVCARCCQVAQQTWASDWTEANEADPELPSYRGATGLCQACFVAWYGREPR